MYRFLGYSANTLSKLTKTVNKQKQLIKNHEKIIKYPKYRNPNSIINKKIIKISITYYKNTTNC